MITGQPFHFPNELIAAQDRVMRNLAGYLA
jgi:hypothetical protein